MRVTEELYDILVVRQRVEAEAWVEAGVVSVGRVTVLDDDGIIREFSDLYAMDMQEDMDTAYHCVGVSSDEASRYETGTLRVIFTYDQEKPISIVEFFSLELEGVFPSGATHHYEG